MTNITPDLIKSIITRDDKLYVPESITDAIGYCIQADVDTVRKGADELKAAFKSAQEKMEPFKWDYSRDVTIEGYSADYLPRNTLVPKLAILCCAYDAAFQNLPDRLSVLDLGSGTGGVVLGLLDLFHNKALSATRIDILALDLSLKSLIRQRKLVERLGLRGSSHKWWQVDLSDPASYQSKLSMGAPYDMVFAANIFGELKEQPTDDLLQRVAPLLSDNGIVVIVESQSNYVKAQRTSIVETAIGLGLHVFYPCPPDSTCPASECWKWRTDEFQCPDIMVHGKAFEVADIHIAHWLIFCRKHCSIYNMLQKKKPALTWGVAAPRSREPYYVGDIAMQRYEFCTDGGSIEKVLKMPKDEYIFSQQSELVKRGSIIGLPADSLEVEVSEIEVWDIV